MNATVFFLLIAVVTLTLLFNLVRSRRLREKYVALWMVVGVLIILLALFPSLLGALARAVGVLVPANLLFFLAIILLLGVCLQLSLEISRTEDKLRTLAEHVAILNLQMHELVDKQPAASEPAQLDDVRGQPQDLPQGNPAVMPEPDR